MTTVNIFHKASPNTNYLGIYFFSLFLSTGVCPDLIITGGEAIVSYKRNSDLIEVATVECLKPKRYALIGGKEVTCQSNNTWSATPECRLCGTDYFT